MPSEDLKNWVCSYSGYREDAGRPVCRLEIPQDRVIVILGFGDRLQIQSVGSRNSMQSQAFVVGLSERPLIINHEGAQQCIEIELLPWAANKLFGGAATELAQGIIDLKDLWGSDAKVLVEQLTESSAWPKRFALVEQFLSERLVRSNQAIRSEVQWAWQQLETYGGCVPIRQLARAIGWSDRHFSTCFREQIGVTPKAAARRIRFTRAHQLLTGSEQHTLIEIATMCGYSDQSHFTREFHGFAACSPTVYRAAHFPDLLGTPGDIINQ